MNWLLLRGLARERRHWFDFADQLAAAPGSTRVLCLDLPGISSSPEREFPWSIAAAREALRRQWSAQAGDGAWSLLGISLGGMIALSWLAAYPDDFSRGVIINSSARDLGLPFERFAPATALIIPRLLLGGGAVARERAILGMTTAMLDERRMAELAQRGADVWSERPLRRRVFFQQLLAATRFRAPRHLEPPVLLLSSLGDILVSPRCTARLARRYGTHRVHPRAGHDLPSDDPQWVLAQMAQWEAGS